MSLMSATVALNWWTKRKLYRLGYYLQHEFDGVHARSFSLRCW